MSPVMGEHLCKDYGLSRWHIVHTVEASLKRLGMDCFESSISNGTAN